MIHAVTMTRIIITLLLYPLCLHFTHGYMYQSESSMDTYAVARNSNRFVVNGRGGGLGGGGDDHKNSIMTLGDLDGTNDDSYSSNSARDFYKNTSHVNNQQPLSSRVYRPMENSWASAFYSTDRSQPPPLRQIAYNFFVNLHNLSPTLSYGTMLCFAVFVLWQVPELSRGVLQRHFVCSYTNVIEGKRLHAMLLSALSHSGIRHLFLNIYAYVTFGGTVKNAMNRQSLSLFPFVLGSALMGSLFHLLLSRNAGSLGLSGVTLALFAFVARIYPSRQFRVIFFPSLRVYAQHALLFAIIVSVFGILTGSNQGIAHATHLGGLAFGLCYYEAFVSGILKKIRR